MSSIESERKFMDIVSELIDPSIQWKDIEWIKSNTKLPIVLKGILTGKAFKHNLRVYREKIFPLFSQRRWQRRQWIAVSLVSWFPTVERENFKAFDPLYVYKNLRAVSKTVDLLFCFALPFFY